MQFLKAVLVINELEVRSSLDNGTQKLTCERSMVGLGTTYDFSLRFLEICKLKTAEKQPTGRLSK